MKSLVWFITGASRGFGLERWWEVQSLRAGRHARGEQGQWTALRTRYSDHRGAAGATAVLTQITDVAVA